MNNRIILTISLILFILVLIGVTLIEAITKSYPILQPLVPMVVITGFFTFLVSVGLFLHAVIDTIKPKKS